RKVCDEAELDHACFAAGLRHQTGRHLAAGQQQPRTGIASGETWPSLSEKPPDPVGVWRMVVVGKEQNVVVVRHLHRNLEELWIDAVGSHEHVVRERREV